MFAMLIVVRIGSQLPIPGVSRDYFKDFFSQQTSALNFFNAMTGGSFTKMSIFALSITPYITSSIIMQLLTIAIPKLEEMQKDGEDGRKKIVEFTRYLNIVLSIIEGAAFAIGFGNSNLLQDGITVKSVTVMVLSLTAGSAFLMWLGEQITEKGVGNGISLIIFAGIVSRIPSMVTSLYQYIQNGSMGFIGVLALLIVALLVIGVVVAMNEAERRISVQYAKRVVGRKMYGGQSTHIPIKVASAGVIPIIFAMSIMAFPGTIAAFAGVSEASGGFWGGFLKIFSPNHWLYAVLYFLLIIFFTYFYTAIQFNPIEMANNMKKNGGFIPGIRPGRPTSDYISRTLSKITLAGAIFLGIIAVIPIFMNLGLHINNFSIGGTSLLIVVGVALETVTQLESQMLMRHYKGFLE